MPRTCTREQVRELDRRAIEDYGIPGLVLMENAGRGAAAIAVEMLGEPWDKRVVIFCGRGNNGGDGYVVGRHLHNRGIRVDFILACNPENMREESDAGVNLAIVRNMGLPIHVADSDEGEADAAVLAGAADLIVDALLGTGLTGHVREPFLSLIRLINAADKPVLSIDMPSGLDANTGDVLGAAVRAESTATFVLPKRGFYLLQGPGHTGEVKVVDIGMPKELIDEIETTDEHG